MIIMSIYFLLFTPLLVSFFLFLTPLPRRAFEALAAVAGLVELGAALRIAFADHNGGPVFANMLSYDALAAWFVLIISVLGMLALSFSVSYLRRESEVHGTAFSKDRQYFALFHLFLFTMFVAAGANNVLLLWIAVEATTLTSAFLVNFFDRAAAIEAAWKYMIINTVALLLGLFGVFLFIGAVQQAELSFALDWASIAIAAPLLDVMLIKIAFVFMVIGYGTKAGLAPLHNWLPDAHSQAPSPVSALLSGALLNIALLALLRFKAIVDVTAGAAFSQTILVAFGVISIVVASALILTQKHYKRLLAYSSVEHMGIIAIGFALGGVAAVAALLHALYHSLAKAMLFLSSGNILLRYQVTEIHKVKGLLRTLPFTGFFFFAGLLAVAGVPPFGTFLTEFAIFSSLFAIHPYLTIAALLALAIAFVGIMRHVSATCFGESEAGCKQGEDDRLAVLPIAILFLLLLTLSLYRPDALLSLLDQATHNLVAL